MEISYSYKAGKTIYTEHFPHPFVDYVRLAELSRDIPRSFEVTGREENGETQTILVDAGPDKDQFGYYVLVTCKDLSIKVYVRYTGTQPFAYYMSENSYKNCQNSEIEGVYLGDIPDDLNSLGVIACYDPKTKTFIFVEVVKENLVFD